MKHLESIIPAIIALVVVVFGVVGIWYGEQDDAPGAQLLGGLVVVGTLVLVVRTVRSTRH